MFLNLKYKYSLYLFCLLKKFKKLNKQHYHKPLHVHLIVNTIVFLPSNNFKLIYPFCKPLQFNLRPLYFFPLTILIKHITHFKLFKSFATFFNKNSILMNHMKVFSFNNSHHLVHFLL